MSDIDRIKEKLAKLLRLGENEAASEGEIQNALDLAYSLMAKHQLTRDDIDTSAPDPIAKVVFGRHFAFCKGTSLTAWENALATFVRTFIGSVSCYNAGAIPVRRNGMADLLGNVEDGPRKAVAMVFYGADDDARCAASLFEELRDAVATMAIIRWGGWMRGDGGAYAYGFATGLLEAHSNARGKLMNSDSTTSALILKSEQTSLAIIDRGKQWLSETHNVTLSKAKSKRRIRFSGNNTQTAFREGRTDGSNYNPTRPPSRKTIG